MRDTFHGEDHAVAAARLDGHWLTLDNRRMAMVEDADVRNYRPLFVIDQSGIMQYADPPLLARARRTERRAAGRTDFCGATRPDRACQLKIRLRRPPAQTRRVAQGD